MPVIAQNQKLLQFLAPEERTALERICPPRKFKKGQAIYRYQDRADDLFIVHEGKVKITAPTADGGERILSILGPGDFFGESFLSGQERHTTDAVAMTQWDRSATNLILCAATLLVYCRKRSKKIGRAHV